MQKRAQAAMEFLMTYGWAIIAVLISLGGLAYFGVLNPGLFVPESCSLFPGVACLDAKVNAEYVVLKVQNGLGDNLNNFNINIPGCKGVTLAKDGVLKDGETQTFAVSCNLQGNALKADLTINYIKGGLAHTKQGKLSAKIAKDADSSYKDGCAVFSAVGTGCGISPVYCWSSTDFESATIPSVPCETPNSCYLTCAAGGFPHATYRFDTFTVTPGNYVAIARVFDYMGGGVPADPTNFGLTVIDGMGVTISNTIWKGGTVWKWGYATVPFTITTANNPYSLKYVYLYNNGWEPDLNLNIDDVRIIKV